MSHFTVLVIGNDPESQLAPFHEFECTGVNDEYVQDIDKTEEARQEYVERDMERHGDKSFAEYVEYYYGVKVVPFGEKPQTDDVHKFGYVLVDKNGDVVKVIRRTNPNRKWDWYQVGGRWAGFFKLKAGTAGEQGKPSWMLRGETVPKDRVDSVRKGDIDIEGMRDDAAREAAADYDGFMAVLNGRPMPPSFAEIRAKHDNIDAAREEYNGLEVVKDLRAADKMPWFADVGEIYGCGREKFMQRAMNKVIQTFAVLKDGEWYERGEMGWWGMAHNELDEDDWNAQFSKLFDELPDDTLLTVVDCHI